MDLVVFLCSVLVTFGVFVVDSVVMTVANVVIGLVILSGAEVNFVSSSFIDAVIDVFAFVVSCVIVVFVIFPSSVVVVWKVGVNACKI